MFHPTRGGTRGGQDQFKWEDVKEDKHRENYLGNSLHAAVGRWQKGRDVTWYAKAGSSDKDLATIQANKQAEVQSIKDAEAEAMAEALGYKTKRKVETNVTEKELKSAISKTNNGVQDEMDERLKDSSAIEGLGFKNRAQRMYADNRPENGSRRPATAANATPIVPLIPQAIVPEANKVKARGERSLKEQKESIKDESEARRKRHRHDRDRSRSRERSRDKERRSDRDRGRERDGRGSSNKGHREDKRRRDRSGSRNRDRSRSRSPERRTRDRDHGHSRHDRSPRREQEREHRNERRHRNRSRSRS
ncbi:kinase phosphorylation protein-domain-containing protein [Gamsiella multidivaricata]|uniref:kinase phosphorylation protein-domain-containing protein n=1 Tax=Gamsiella multidivaricata TaxID=101098 RepID=UPI00221EB61D|nr:kinase phosphorylation protein-domain-containing protein [Gamsiella multidivaricata]KAG0371167.1 hypothetical protein BGZ54_009526 [Gamsiella multidivaricata]KAI7823628.1 kinase phosphorylation protein-domain-containing protein [Gamsiella multidivaricata]